MPLQDITLDRTCGSPSRFSHPSNKHYSRTKNDKHYSRAGKCFSTPSSKRVQKWSPRNSSFKFNGGSISTPRGHKLTTPTSSYFRRCQGDITRKWEMRMLSQGNLNTSSFAAIMARMLEEKNEFLIQQIVLTLGKEKCVRLMKSTKAVQQLGGLELPYSTPHKTQNCNKPRRTKRTVGGVFIQLSKEEIPTDQWKEINRLSEKKKPKKKKRKSGRKVQQSPKVVFGDPSLDNNEENNRIQPNNLNKNLFAQVNVNQSPITPDRSSVTKNSPAKDPLAKEPLAKEPLTKEPLTKEEIGEALYPKVRAEEPTFAAKVTGMLLEGMDNLSLTELMERPGLLKQAVNEAMQVYNKEFSGKIEQSMCDQDQSGQRESLGNELYDKVRLTLTVEDQRLASKLTGMLLELPLNEVQRLLADKSSDVLNSLLQNSLWVLRKEKQNLGNVLYPRVKLYTDDEKAKKVTGMLLEMDTSFLGALRGDPHMLKQKVDECLTVLDANNLVLNFVSPKKCNKKYPR